MNGNLEGNRILFIGQVFYDYHERIMTQMERMGAEVIFYENRLFREDPVIHHKSLISKFKRLLNPGFKVNYNQAILNETAGLKFDILFCIGGFSLSPHFIQAIKERNAGIRCIIYFWDSFNVWPFQYLIPYFDEVYSFERSDSIKYKVNYLPLFFSKKIDRTVRRISSRDLDLLYVGSVGPLSQNRFKILASIDKACKQQDLKCFFYLLYTAPQHNKIVKMINAGRRVFDLEYKSFARNLRHYRSHYDFVKDKPLNGAKLDELLSNAKCVIDIQVPGQSGLTMRTIESLSLGCKLLTTNLAVKEEPFYNPQWIQIITDDDFELNLDFIKAEPDSKVNIDYLSLDNWVTNMLGN